MIALEQNHRTFRIPAVFTFSFFDEQEKQVHYVSIKRKWISVGADFEIASDGRRIGEIDGQLLSFGFNARVSVCDPALAENRQLVDLLTLFTATVGYHRAMRKRAAARAGGCRRDVVPAPGRRRRGLALEEPAPPGGLTATSEDSLGARHAGEPLVGSGGHAEGPGDGLEDRLGDVMAVAAVVELDVQIAQGVG